MKPLTKFAWVFLFAVAMGYMESAVVVYLRAIYYPSGFDFPLKMMSQILSITEIYREAATIVMIVAIGILLAKYRLHRFAWFLIVFGIWDIAYYVFLKVLIGWPDSFFTTDILFLIPCIWTGPIVAPLINSILMLVLAGTILINRKGAKPTLSLSPRIWILLTAGSLIVITSYMEDFASYTIHHMQTLPPGQNINSNYILLLSAEFVPGSFDWWLYSIGVCLHLTAILLLLKQKGTN